jgi:hypothetical protein
MSWGSEWPKDDVGYGKPPKDSRFRPGQSGNPKGRPKTSKNARTLLQKALNEKVLVNKGGVERWMTKLEVFIDNFVARATKDDRSAALLIKTMDQHDLMKAPEVRDTVIRFVNADDKKAKNTNVEKSG